MSKSFNEYLYSYNMSLLSLLLVYVFFSNYVSTNKNVDNTISTSIEIKNGDSYVIQKYLLEDINLEEQIKSAESLVIGTVKEILPTVETIDLIDSGIVDVKKNGYNFLHTDMVIKVDNDLMDNIGFDKIVIRRYGGRLGNFVHVKTLM